MQEDLSQLAIAAAMRGEWKQALATNLEILKQSGSHTDVLNRIARSYTELGSIDKAKKFAQKVLKIDPYNSIAQKTLLRVDALSKNGKKSSSRLNLISFLEEAGKTKIISLINLCNPALRLTLDCGEEVTLEQRAHSISALSSEGKYLGKLPDDLAVRIAQLIRQGNEYKAYIKNSSLTDIKIFIKEVKRSQKISHIPSFPAEKINYIAFTAPELVHNQKSSSSKR